MRKELTEEKKVEVACRLQVIDPTNWTPGMRTLSGRRITGVVKYEHEGTLKCHLYGVKDDGLGIVNLPHSERFIDMADPGTIGGLMYLVRRKSGVDTAWVVFHDDRGKWGVHWSGSTHGGDFGWGDFEGEALVNALENLKKQEN